MKESIEIMSPTIKIAQEHHIPGIVAIVEKLKMDPYVPDPEKLMRGFLTLPLDTTGYVHRLNDLFIVNLGEEKVTGFLMCYDRPFLQVLIDSGQEQHERRIMDFIKSAEPKDNFIYAGQIGVDPEVRQQGIGKSMVERVFASMRDRHINHMYAAILHSPVRNATSIAFATATGAKNIGEARNDDGLLWGIYRWSTLGEENRPDRGASNQYH